MLGYLAIVVGAALVVLTFADLLNTLVTTSTSRRRLWPSQFAALMLLRITRRLALRLPEESDRRERLLASLGPLLILFLLLLWISLQVFGFAMIWWASDGVEGVSSFPDALYYSGVVYFTVGFGEVLPADAGPRLGALIEAGCGVVTTALVVGYLPSLYSAYSAREQKLMTIDDGSDDRITPTNLIKAWAPGGDQTQLNAKLAEWEEWVASIHETHTTLPMLLFFRSHDRRQNWVTAVGLLADVAIHAQITVQGAGRTPSYWLLRRIIALFEDLTHQADLSHYLDEHSRAPAEFADSDATAMFDEVRKDLAAHGFELLPREVSMRRAAAFRNRFAPPMEHLIDLLLAPRGFWSPALNIDMFDTEYLDFPEVEPAHPQTTDSPNP